ncbi:MAG: hypothetical protein COA98_04935 [Candidatus Neomarinimicrobiota bacterium]|nr:MAG: hypothetical protein COA98_04935 [Candidatus Neomarinimicrobiota bacterium]
MKQSIVPRKNPVLLLDVGVDEEVLKKIKRKKRRKSQKVKVYKKFWASFMKVPVRLIPSVLPILRADL